eukprot:gnl/MRDRNA2_/MRDRNA2_129229_c0_seq1.p1 gnl/MRDRNA2_/MRDRNA2_129229_c0~~gnl/MRDRNA2_/MRDRNA2_129229_c0_seq1.p1  ORF type:complete len:106 (-),score=11.65 gnl/MRDRNA2_/MRDRNA2_129229_c0_seq1:98-415(-)
MKKASLHPSSRRTVDLTFKHVSFEKTIKGWHQKYQRAVGVERSKQASDYKDGDLDLHRHGALGFHRETIMRFWEHDTLSDHGEPESHLAHLSCLKLQVIDLFSHC